MKKETLISGILAVTLFVCALIGTWFGLRPTEKNISILCLGDSLIGNERDDTVVTDVMQEILKKNVFNGAFGGTCMSIGNRQNKPDYYEDSLGMCELAEAIAVRDFVRQKADIKGNQFKLPYFDQVVWDLADIDFSRVEVLIIEHGTNDYNAGRPLDNPDDLLDKTTFGGALRYSLETLKKAYPDLRIIVCTPIYCAFETMGEDCYSFQYGYGNLEDYVNLELQIAREYNIEIIDNFHNIGIHKDNYQEYLYDGIHLNAVGRKMLGETLAGYLLSTE